MIISSNPKSTVIIYDKKVLNIIPRIPKINEYFEIYALIFISSKFNLIFLTRFIY